MPDPIGVSLSSLLQRVEALEQHTFSSSPTFIPLKLALARRGFLDLMGVAGRCISLELHP